MAARPPHYLDKYTLGHEGCGEVVSVGPKVTKFQPGEMVSILSVPGCGTATCRECSGGVPQICSTGEHYGIGNDGSFAPYVAIRERAAVKLPPGVSAAAGAVATDACVTAYQAVVRRAKVKKGDTVLLYGLGGLGFNALQMILHIGARVVVVDRRQAVLDEAVRFGVKTDDVVPVGTASVSEWVQARGLVVDSAIDFVGVPETFKTAIESVRMAGTVVLVGLLHGELTLPSFVAVRKQLDILCSYGGTVEDLVASLDLISQGIITPQVETGSMADFPHILEDLHAGKIKSRIALVPEDLQ
ncbi:Alcohol dehydrogenase GroES-like domain-containing protein isoform 2 [Cladophialophora immunda]|nr:Alcohol dehydrogenase GroES-like domain-containing protein isoform 2 [Cladophialophora immunda]